MANLGQLPEAVVENLRRAFRAGAKGEVLVLPEDASLPADVLASRAYLDLAVALDFWHRLGLEGLLADLFAGREVEVPIQSVIAALTLHRCVAPGSKLSAQQWFPRTSLPTLLALPSERFNNTRVHRALDALEEVGSELQRRLSTKFAADKHGYTALFLDLTDTWFVGVGPKNAEENTTKEGLWRRKVGIVLLCDQDGFPIRWSVLPGRRPDSKAMSDMAGQVGSLDWARDVPLVCDRAMGHPRLTRGLARRGVQFVTMLNSRSFDAFAGDSIPYALTEGLAGTESDATELADAAAERSGMSRARDRLRVLDLGIRDAVLEPVSKRRAPIDHAAVLARAREIRTRTAAGERLNQIARDLGVARSGMTRALPLLEMSPEALAMVEAGRVSHLTTADLLRVAAIPRESQEKSLLASLAARIPEASRAEPEEENDEEPCRARVVVVFNPALFAAQRRAAKAKQARLEAEIAALNTKLASPMSLRKEAQVTKAVERILSSYSFDEEFEFTVTTRQCLGKSRFEVKLSRREEAWAASRRRDGFNVLVAHPDLRLTPEQLVCLYAAKNQVEENFHVIKSLVDVRPVFHRKDAKVDAHVSICMLALLLHRAIEKAVGDSATASAILADLGNVHLVELQIGNTASRNLLVKATEAQRTLLSRLGCQHLLDPRRISAAMS